EGSNGTQPRGMFEAAGPQAVARLRKPPARLATPCPWPPFFLRSLRCLLVKPLLQCGPMNTGITAINDEVQKTSAFIRPLFTEIGKVVVGQAYLIERLVIGLLANGHVLLEGVPGLAKTLSVKTLAACLNVKFSRLQFTPDML